MHRTQTSKFLAILLSLCLLITCIPFSASAAVPPITPVEPPDDSILISGVSWSNTSIVTTVVATIPLGQTASFAQLGLSAFACYNGRCSTDFTWYASNNLITISSDNLIHANTEGMVEVTGVSNTFGESLGRLTLILFVANSGYTDVTLIDAMDDLYKEELIYDIKEVLREQMNYSESDIRTHPIYPPVIITPDVLMGYVASSKIVVFSGHGEANRIQLSLYGSSATFLSSSHLDSLPADIFDNCELLLLDACLTAAGGKTGDNIINAFLDHGVETVVGFEVSILAPEADMWVEAFFTELANGKTVQAACDSAWDKVNKHEQDFAGYGNTFGGTKHSCAVGNENKTI